MGLSGQFKVKNNSNQRSNNSSSAKQGGLSRSQIMSRKLLRSIKRRQFQHTNTPQFKRKLIDSSLEEGEIKSDVEETLVSNATASEDNDDDCIYIEPEIDQIVIDDDTPASSSSHTLNRFASGKISIVDKLENSSISAEHTKLLTSTPFAKLKDNLPADEINDNKAPAFFMDTSRTPWFELNKSDADYIKLSTLREKNIKKRKSTRFLNKNSNHSSDQVIVLDDSTISDITLEPPAKKSNTQVDTKAMDDSVIFISETNPNVQQFIPLESTNVPNPVKIVQNPLSPKKKPFYNELFTSSEKKEMNAYNINAYNPDANERPMTKQRMVLIDGSNVAFKHSLDVEFSVKGLKICIEYFDKMGHEVKAVVPQFRLHKCSDPDEMSRLHKAGKIVFTPCKFLNGKNSSSYDDRFVLQLACELDAAIVSNDNYRDLVHENSAFKKMIENRVMSFTWCNDIFILAKDPYGKWGPPLHSILNRS